MELASSQRSREQKKFLFIVGLWTFLGAILTVYDHFLISSHLTSGYSEGSSFLKSFITNTFAGIMGGVAGGYTLVYLVNKKFRSTPYYKSILVVCISFILVITFITLTLAFIQAFYLYGGINNQEGMALFTSLIFTTEHVKNIIYWGGIVGFTQLGLQINDKFGQGLLWSMITGKYHLPRTEERIFMFLDLKGSTTIAERMENKLYHHFLKDLFSDITDPILANAGQIYQYVGDEVIISWKSEIGVMKNNCLQCFFDIQQTLESLKEKYMTNYGIQPEFKAGIHMGTVIAGEIGIIKRDITYSGDTLNTTSRIQGMCNQFNKSLLVSGKLAGLLSLNNLKISNLGNLHLKGKVETIDLIAIEV